MTAKSKTERSRAAVKQEYPLTRMRAWFKEHPYEMLTMPDVCTKFGLTKEQAQNILRTLNSEGVAHRRTMVCGKEAC